MTLYRVNRDDKTYTVGPVGPCDPYRGTRLGMYSEDKAEQLELAEKAAIKHARKVSGGKKGFWTVRRNGDAFIVERAGEASPLDKNMQRLAVALSLYAPTAIFLFDLSTEDGIVSAVEQTLKVFCDLKREHEQPSEIAR